MKHHRRYTLIEVLVAVAVLVLMMSFLFQFTSGAQRIWMANNRATDVTDNATAVFSLLNDDFFTMQEVKIGSDTLFGIESDAANNTVRMKFFTLSNHQGAGASDTRFGSLVFVEYYFDAAAKKLYRFEKNAENGTIFLAANNEMAQNVSFSTEEGAPDDYLVADGVESFQVTPNPIDNTVMPNYFKTKIVLKHTENGQPDETSDEKKTFSKVFFIKMK